MCPSAVYSREETQTFFAIVNELNIAELLGEGGPRRGLAHRRKSLEVPLRAGTASGAQSAGTAEQAVPFSVLLLVALEPVGLVVRS